MQLEIKVDEWHVAQGKADSIEVVVTWRGAAEDPTLANLLAAVPPGGDFVPMKLVDGRTALAPEGWKYLRFGKGPPIFELARSNYEGWAGGPADRVAQDRKRLTAMIRPYITNFDDYTDKDQVDFIIRTQAKINAVRDSVKDLIAHLEYAAPRRYKALPPLKNPRRKVQAAVFCDVMSSSRRAGELLGIPVAPSDKDKYQNQTVRAMAKPGRELLCNYFGVAGWKAKVERMREYWRWWERFNSLDDPKEQMYALLAKARGTSPEQEKLLSARDGFDGKLDEWVAVVEKRLEIEEIQDQNKYNDDFAWPGAIESERRTAQTEQFRIQETDERFAKALSVFDAPPDAAP
jgi:hypothetical protein